MADGIHINNLHLVDSCEFIGYKAGQFKDPIQSSPPSLQSPSPRKAGFPQEALNEIHGAWFDPSNPVVPMRLGHRTCRPWPLLLASKVQWPGLGAWLGSVIRRLPKTFSKRDVGRKNLPRCVACHIQVVTCLFSS